MKLTTCVFFTYPRRLELSSTLKSRHNYANGMRECVWSMALEAVYWHYCFAGGIPSPAIPPLARPVVQDSAGSGVAWILKRVEEKIWESKLAKFPPQTPQSQVESCRPLHGINHSVCKLSSQNSAHVLLAAQAQRSLRSTATSRWHRKWCVWWACLEWLALENLRCVCAIW